MAVRPIVVTDSKGTFKVVCDLPKMIPAAITKNHSDALSCKGACARCDAISNAMKRIIMASKDRS